jgi:hypothetical protein
MQLNVITEYLILLMYILEVSHIRRAFNFINKCKCYK